MLLLLLLILLLFQPGPLQLLRPALLIGLLLFPVRQLLVVLEDEQFPVVFCLVLQGVVLSGLEDEVEDEEGEEEAGEVAEGQEDHEALRHARRVVDQGHGQGRGRWNGLNMRKTSRLDARLPFFGRLHFLACIAASESH